MVSSAGRRPFEFVGNHIVLDFINTVNARPTFTRDDLASADDVAAWGLAAGLAGPGRATSARPPSAAPFRRAVALRETLFQVFWPIAEGHEPSAAALESLARSAAMAVRSAQWARVDSGYEPMWNTDPVDSMCDRIADAGLQLLRSPDVARIGRCQGCGWLFLDTSRAHARRWCAMSMCGARDKMRRYHQRQAELAGAS